MEPRAPEGRPVRSVLLLNQYYPPSDAPTGLLLADLAKRLVERGHRVRVLTSRRAYEDPRVRYAAREQRDGAEVRRLRTLGPRRSGPAGRLADYLSFLAGVALRTALGRRPDVVVTLSTPPMLSTVAVLAAGLRGCRSVYWVMDVYPDIAFALGVLRADSLVGRWLAAVERRALRRADEVVALGDTMAHVLREHGATSVTALPNWLAGPEIPRDVDPTPLRSEWKWGDDFVVLYSGNLGLAYEFETALAAAARLRDRRDVRFAFVGRGPRRAEIETAIRTRGLTNVEIRDPLPRDRLAAGLAAGDLHLITLRPEAAGLLVPSKIFGTLAAGRPVIYIGPEDDDVANLVRDAGCGVRIAPGDAVGLESAIRAYAAEPERLRAHGAQARRAHDERYAPGRSLDGLVRRIEGSP